MPRAHRPFALALAAVVGLGLAPAARADDTAALGPEHVAALLSVQRQLADIDSWQTTQFKPAAWERAGAGLAAYLARPGDFKAAVGRLRADRFRGCVDADEYKKFRDELARLKDDARPAGKADPIRLSEDVVETVLVVEAAYPWLDAAADGWREPPDAKAAEAAVLRALGEYQTFHRRQAKVRLLGGQPEWVLKALGPGLARPLDEARAALAAIDAGGGAGGGWTAERVQKLPPRPDAAAVRAQSDKLLAATQAAADWFKENGAAVLKRRAEWEERFRTPTVDAPADGPTSGKWFVRASLKPLAGGRFEARLSLCRALPAAVRGGVDEKRFRKEYGEAAPPEAVKPQPVLEELDLGVTLASVQLAGGRVVLPPSGLGADRTDDRAALTRALYRLGLPPGLGVERVEVVSVAPDFTRLTVKYAVALPGLGLAHEDTVELAPGARPAEEAFAGVLNARADELRDRLVALANAKPVELAVPGGKVRATNWRAAGDWRAGNVALAADLTFPNLGTWAVPLELVKAGDRWALRPGAHAIPAKVLDAALEQFRAAAVKGLDPAKLPPADAARVGKVGGFVAKFATRIALADPVFDPRTGAVVADVRWAEPGLPGAAAVPAAKLEIRLAAGEVRFDAGPMAASLARQWPQLAVGVLNQLTGNLKADAARNLKDKPLTFFGQSFKVVEVGNFDDARNGVPVDFAATVGGRELRVNRCWLLGLTLPVGAAVDALKVDFSEATTQPGPDAFLGELLGARLKLDAGLLQVSGVRPAGAGFRATVALRVDALGGPVPLGDLTFDRAGVGAELNPDALTNAIATRFAERLTIPDLGPVRKLRLDAGTAVAPAVRVVVKGELVVGDLDVALPFTGVQVFPKLDLSQLKIDPATPALAKLLSEVLPLPADTVVAVTNVKPKLSAPYGVSFDLGVNFWVLKLSLGQVSVTTKGVEVPEKVQLRLPAFVSLGPLALVNPGVGIYLKDAGKIDILGDLTFASPGVDLLIAIRCTLTADLKNLRFHLNGTLVALSFLPVFAVDGDADLKGGVFDLTGKTLPPLDRIISLTGNIHVDGPAFRLTSSTNLSVLGLNLLSINLLIDGRTAFFHLDGAVNFLIGTARIGVELTPDLARCNATAELNFEVFGFSIAGARVDISPARVQLQFKILGFKVTIVVATISALTPKIVLDVIESLFDFDPVAFFKALVRREVVVNLIDSKGKPTEGSVGEGRPLPPGQPGAPDRTPPPGGQPPAPKEGGGQPATTPASEFGGVPPGGGAPAAGGWVGPRGELPKDNRPNDVIVYQPGTGSARFEPDPEAPGKFYEITTDGKERWSSHFAIEPGVKDALKKPTTLVLTPAWVALPAGTAVRCRATNCGPHNLVPVYVTLDRERKAVCVAGMFPGGRYEELPLKAEQIGPGLAAEPLWERITARGEKPLLPGDVALLAAAAQARIDPKRGFDGLRRVRAGSGNAEDDGYVFVSGTGPAGRATFMARRGGGFVVGRGHPLYPALADPNAPLAGPLTQFLAERTAATELFALLAVDFGPPAPGAAPVVRRAAFVRQDKEKRCWVEAVAAAGRKSVRLTTDYPFLGNRRPAVYDGGPLAAALLDGVLSGTWDELRLPAPAAGPRQLAFANKLEAADWAVAVVREQSPGGPVVRAELPGAALLKNYAAWQARKAVTAAGAQALGDLGTGAQRRQLLDVVTGPDAGWPKFFQANPAGLLVPGK